MTIADPGALAAFLLLVCRGAGWVATVPVFSARGIPALVKAGLVLVLSIACFPTIAGVRPSGGLSASGWFFSGAVAELLLGAALGWLCSLAFRAAEAAGSIVDAVSGMGFAAQFDPTTGASSTAFARYYSMVFTAVVLATNAHHQVFLAFGRLLEAVPVGTGFTLDGPLVTALGRTMVTMLAAAITLAAPLLGALLITDAALGLMARFYPQSNMLSMSMSLKPLVALAVSGTALAVLPQHVPTMVEESIRLAGRVLG